MLMRVMSPPSLLKKASCRLLPWERLPETTKAPGRVLFVLIFTGASPGACRRAPSPWAAQ